MSQLLLDHWALVTLVGIAAILLVLARMLLREGPPPYQRRDVLLSGDERRLYVALREAAGDDWAVLSMVRLADLIQVVPGTTKRQSWQNRISSRRVAFVVCDPTTFEPRLVVELDRRRKKREPLGDREYFLERALVSAGLPLLWARPDGDFQAALEKLEVDGAARKAA